MNNREYANTLSDKDFVAWGRKFFGTDWDSASVVMNDVEIEEASVKILNQPHETTGHEDLVNAGWAVCADREWEITYKSIKLMEEKFINIMKEETAYWTYELGGRFLNKEIDFIRKCADKIRKERGWA